MPKTTKATAKHAELQLSVCEADAHIECKGDPNDVTLYTKGGSGTSEMHQICLSHEGMLKLAFQVLTDPQIREMFPHCALPEGVDAALSSGASTQTETLKSFRDDYRSRYGSINDQFGRANVVGHLKRRKDEAISWGGAVSAQSATTSGAQSYQLQADGPVSIHLVLDLLVSFVRDSQTMRYYPQYSASYLRRWGEDAFEQGKLKSGVPEILTRETHLKEQEPEEADFAADALQGLGVPPVSSIPGAEAGEGTPGGVVVDESILARLEGLDRREKELNTREARMDRREQALKREGTQIANKARKLSQEQTAARTNSQDEKNTGDQPESSSGEQAEIDRKLEMLQEEASKLLHAQRELKDGNDDLSRREQEYVTRLSTLTRHEDLLRERKQKIAGYDKKLAELVRRETEVSQRAESITEREKSVEKLEPQLLGLEKRAGRVRAKEKELSEQVALQSKIAKQQGQKEQELRRESERLDPLAQDLDTREREVTTLKARLDNESRELQKARVLLDGERSLFETELSKDSEELAVATKKTEELLERAGTIEQRIGESIAAEFIQKAE